MISGRSHIQSCEAVIGTVQSSFQWYCVEAAPGRPSILDSTHLTQWKINLDNRFSAVSMMSVLTFRNPNLRACRLQIGHECEGIVGRYPCTRRLRL